MAAVLSASIKPCAAKCVALGLAWHANAESGHAWPSLPTIAREAGLSERHAKRAMQRLRELGVLTVVKPSNGGAQRATTVYAFDMGRLDALSDPVRGRTPCADAPPARAHPQDGNRKGDAAGRPLAPAAPEGARGRPLPPAPAHPEIDERPKALSSKAPSVPTQVGPVGADARPASCAAAPGPGGGGKSSEPQQPLTKGDRGARTDSASNWLRTPGGIEAKGQEVGLGVFDPAKVYPGARSPWGGYTLAVMKAAGVIPTGAAKAARRHA